LSPTSYATGTGPSAIAIPPSIHLVSNPFLYTANTGGSNDISAYSRDENSGGLTPKAGSPFPSGSSVSSLAFGGVLKNFLYAADAQGGAAAIYGFSIDLGSSVDPNGGSLTSLAGFPYPLPSCTFIVTDETGFYLYATAGTNVLGYSIDQLTGTLSPLAGFPVAVGANADSLTIDPTNQFLYVRNGSAGTVTGFELHTATGGVALTPMSGSPFVVGTSADFIATF
jgi:6-phosphogluconolactonase (cycloisomerase 2 family)